MTFVVAVAGVVALAGLAIGAAELPHWVASRRHFGPRPRRRARSDAAAAGPPAVPSTAAPAGRDVVLVLGYPSGPGGRIHPLQRWRTEIAVRSMGRDANPPASQDGPGTPAVAAGDGGEEGQPGPDARHATTTLLVFSGAATRDADVAEAETMARYARTALGVPADRIALETRAYTTVQNLTFATPYLESAETIKIASDPLHAARARRYLAQLRPDLAIRVAPADDYRCLEKPHLKLATVAYEVTRPLLRHVMPPLRAWYRARAHRNRRTAE